MGGGQDDYQTFQLRLIVFTQIFPKVKIHGRDFWWKELKKEKVVLDWEYYREKRAYVQGGHWAANDKQ